MAKLTSTLYRFNGHCEMSRDADLVLLFEDGTILKAHSLILRKASPVFETILKQETTEVLSMKTNDYFAWCTILNYIYPGTLHNDEFVLLHDLVIEGVVREAQKYQIKSIVSQIDRAITKNVFETQLRIDMRLIEIPAAFSFIKNQERLMIAAAKYQLPRALQASNKCLATFLASVLKYSVVLEVKKPEERLQLDYNNSVMTLNSERLHFADLIEAGYSDLFFKFRSVFLAYE